MIAVSNMMLISDKGIHFIFIVIVTVIVTVIAILMLLISL